MEVSYKRDMNHTYLILRGGEKVDTSAYPVRMMLSNQWETFLPVSYTHLDVYKRQPVKEWSGRL